MSPEQFTDYFLNPGRLDSSSVTALEEIIREYPFCQPAHLLYLKGLQNDKSIRFNRQLKIAAAYASNRRILFEMLNVPDSGAETTEAIPVAEQIAQPAEAVLIPKVDIESVESGKSELLQQVENFLPIEDSDLLLFDFPAYTDDGYPELPSQNRAPEFEMTDEPTDQELLKMFLETDPLSRRRSHEPVPRLPDLIAEIPVIETRPARKTPADDLIDRFIENPQTKVLRPDHAPAHDQDVSLGSLKEDDQFLTETLARIYVQQGYYLKAIQAYEKLSLKIPEKSVYFASQIEMVRELIKNQ